MLSRLVLLATTASLVMLATTVKADNVFGGCLTDDDNTWSKSMVDQTDIDSCTAQCTSEDYNYAGFYGGRLDNQQCYCASNYEAVEYLADSTFEGNCPAGTFTVRITRTDFTFFSCTTPPTFNDGFPFTANGPLSCLQDCASDRIAVFYYDVQGDTYMCRCTSDGIELGATSACGAGNVFIYTHTPASTASEITRRNLRARIARAQASTPKYCPAGYTACNIAGVRDDYECLDTKSDLEACGGCVTGAYGVASSDVGQDCTNMGAKLGAATCLNGQCVASACTRGLKLVDGTCI